MDCVAGLHICSFFFLLLAHSRGLTQAIRPNIVILMVDDLGVADIGCFGNDSLKTPNIDELASQGARLTHSLSSESICTPSRAAFLTGRYAIRSGLAARPNRTRVLLYTSAPGGLPRNETTFAKILENSGYSTGLIGKWHLGLNKEFANDFHYHPLNHGFQFFYGVPFSNYYPCAITVSRFSLVGWLIYSILLIAGLTWTATWLMSKKSLAFLLSATALLCFKVLYQGFQLEFISTALQGQMDCLLLRNFEVVEQPHLLENLTVRLTNEAVRFIKQNHESSFLLFVSYLKVHTPLFTSKAFVRHSYHSSYGSNVEEMDWSVGQIMKTLEQLGIRNNTFVYFTSDHGPDLEQIIDGEYHGGWKGHFKGGKGQSYEGGIRVPSIVSWPSQISAGIDIDEPTISVDIFPTILNIAGAAIPTDRIIDGHDIMPLLKQEAKHSPTEFMYHYCAESLHAVRYKPLHGATTWKAVFITPKWLPSTDHCSPGENCQCYDNDVHYEDPVLLFNITADPSEDFPLTPSDPPYNIVMKQIMEAVSRHKKTLQPVPNQLENNYWYPWRQTCCSYPLCWCRETSGNGTIQ